MSHRPLEIELPKEAETLCHVVNATADREYAAITARKFMWVLAWEYLVNQVRRFDVLDPSTQRVQGYLLDQEGRLEYAAQNLLKAINDNAGVIASMDLMPKTVAQGPSLAAQRDKAVAQVLADSMVNEQAIQEAKTRYAFTLACLGCVGLAGYAEDHPSLGLVGDYEVIHPNELLPFPALGRDFTKTRGLIRQRAVPVEFLKGKYGARKINAAVNRLYGWRVIRGDVMDLGPLGWPSSNFNNLTMGGVNFSSGGAMSSGMTANNADDASMEVALVREVWTFGVRGTVCEYAAISGTEVLERQDLEGMETYCPIKMTRFLETGGFYGAGIFDLLFGSFRQFELMVKSLANNVRDIDRYGFIMLPQGTINQNAALKEVGKGLRALFYEPDPSGMTDTRPIVVQPHNAGEMPGRTAAFMGKIAEALNPVKDLVAEKGRVDNAMGLQVLDESIKQGMSNVTRGVEEAWANAHRNVVAKGVRMLVESPRAIPVKRMTLDLAGSVIDRLTGKMSFAQNPLPVVSRVDFTIRGAAPKSRTAMKAEALQLLQMQVHDRLTMLAFGAQEGLDFATDYQDIKASHEAVVADLLTLYGDGRTPGEVVIAPYFGNLEVMLRVARAFLAGELVRMASVDVQQALIDYLKTLEGWGNPGMLPEGVPTPDEAVENRIAGMKQEDLQQQAAIINS